jgi:hypothetical protein
MEFRLKSFRVLPGSGLTLYDCTQSEIADSAIGRHGLCLYYRAYALFSLVKYALPT